MGHDHSHSHSHAGHNHGAHAPVKVLIIAICLIFAYAIVEAVVGWWSHSLALLGDAGHMGSDALALAIAAFAAWIANKPPSQKHSYGLGRAEVVAAWLSSLLMLIISIAVIVEAIERIHHPSPVKGVPVMVVAFIGLLVNLLVAWVLAKGERTLNIRAALLHVLGDVLGSFAALLSGAVIYFTKWYPIDPILSIFIGVLIAISSLRLLKESLLVLMEGVPAHIDIETVSEALSKIKGVNATHDLHIWTLSSGVVALSCHVIIYNLVDWPTVLTSIQATLKQQFDIDHITLQPESDTIECNPCTDPQK
ncbi:MAG: cation diffusion facilitator family transporter [Gammaproteobacteria bacterium]|nr:cation diffusion facilitator family transporter [Gammaproteobacteria bacterium]MCH9744761.1 cation diffusion facilitator family transporter [Gammaproteobacteria bacterium]